MQIECLNIFIFGTRVDKLSSAWLLIRYTKRGCAAKMLSVNNPIYMCCEDETIARTSESCVAVPLPLGNKTVTGMLFLKPVLRIYRN